MRLTYSAVIFLVFLTSTAFAEFRPYNDPYSSNRVIAPIQIKDKGLYNLVVGIDILNAPYDQKLYKSDPYEKFVRRLRVEWSTVTISQILKAREVHFNELSTLKTEIEAEITKLAAGLKTMYGLDKNVEVIFSLSNFFLLEPKGN